MQTYTPHRSRAAGLGLFNAVLVGLRNKPSINKVNLGEYVETDIPSCSGCDWYGCKAETRQKSILHTGGLIFGQGRRTSLTWPWC